MIEPCEEVKRVEQRYEKALDDMEKHYKDVLDKIREEIEQERQESKDMDDRYAVVVIGKILEIIDKHTKGDNE